MAQPVLTTCPFCSCGCGLYLHFSSGGVLTGVSPSEHHPISRGRLCARGWSAHEATSWGQRLLRPMVRRNGRLVGVDWADAVREAKHRLAAAVRTKQQVGVLASPRATNEENYLAGKLARAALGTNNVDFLPRAAYEPMLAGIADVRGTAPVPGVLDEVDSAEVVLVVEGDLANTHPHICGSVLRARRAGGRVVTLGVAKTQLARAASMHFAVKAGGEGQIINGLLAALVRNAGELRNESLERLVGYEALQDSLAKLRIRDDIREAAKWLGEAEHSVVLIAPTSTPPQRQRRDAAALASLSTLAAQTSGGACRLFALLPRSNFRGALALGCTPGALPGEQAVLDADARRRASAAWAGRDVPTAEGMDAVVMIRSARALVIVADDPSASSPEPDALLQLLRGMDALIVFDAYETATSAAADVVFPIAAFGESEGTLTNGEGRVQRVRRATTAPAQARPGWDALACLINEFGVCCRYGSAAEVFDEIVEIAPCYRAMSHARLDDGWGEIIGEQRQARRVVVTLTEQAPLRSEAYPEVLIRPEAYDWGADPLVAGSPTLCRQHAARRKLFPRGLVELSHADAERLGLRSGGQIVLSSPAGQITMPVEIRPELEPGVLRLPFMFRSHANGVLRNGAVAPVRASRA